MSRRLLRELDEARQEWRSAHAAQRIALKRRKEAWRRITGLWQQLEPEERQAVLDRWDAEAAAGGPSGWVDTVPVLLGGPDELVVN